MKISLEPPSQPEVLQLIENLDAFQKPLYPADSHHGISDEAEIGRLHKFEEISAAAMCGSGMRSAGLHVTATGVIG